MSNSHLFLSAGFPRAPLNNGVGRYTGHLQRIVIKFCKTDGSSRGVREFIESNLVDFARSHPGVVVYVKPRRHRSPSITAEYCNGVTGYFYLKNMSRDQVYKWLDHTTKKQSGDRVMRFRKLWHTDSPSIQGVWSPRTFPVLPIVDEETSVPDYNAGPVLQQPTATEMLVEMFKRQKLEDSANSGGNKEC